MKKIWFFLRHNNDIDHITPIIYKLAKTHKELPIEVIIYSYKQFLNDYRIKYLKQYKNINIHYINEYIDLTQINQYFNINMSSKKMNILQLTQNDLPEIYKTITQQIGKKIFNKTNQGGIVAFDWTVTPFAQYICLQAKKHNFITVSLPHGDSPYTSRLKGVDDIDFTGAKSYKELEIFNYIVVPNQLCYERYRDYIPHDRIKILGSPRYSDEWIQIINKILAKQKINIDAEKKIVLFLRNRGYPVFWEETIRAIKIINNFTDTHLIIKHHPRGSPINEILNIKDNRIQHVGEDISSALLIRWADIIIDIGTSATWEAIKLDKSVIMPEYLYANRSSIVNFMPSCEAKCRDDLFYMIEMGVKYPELERKQFIHNMIDVPDRFVLERYRDFFKEIQKW